MDEESPPPPLKGAVIITLPPVDDPSQGKTITAFTISATPNLSITTGNVPPTTTRTPRQRIRRGSSASLFFDTVISSIWKPLILLLSAAVVFVFIWSWLPSYPYNSLNLLSEEEKEKDPSQTSLLFPLYRKGKQSPSTPSYSVSVDDDGGGKTKRRRMREANQLNLGALNRRKKIAATDVNNSTAILPIAGNISPDGLYYTVIRIGSPPKPYYLDVDTGSDLTWIQCDAPCSSCAVGPNPLYMPTKDKLVPSRNFLCQQVQSNQKNLDCEFCSQCDYEIEYADHSSSMGVLARDELPIKMVNKEVETPSFVFGCAYDQQGQLLVSPAKTDGILGLSGSQVGIPSQLASQNIISNVLGHCISSKETTVGYMFLGDEFVPHWGVTWVPMLRSPMNFYQAEAQRISYGKRQIGPSIKGNDFGHVAFDTGSSYSYFTNAAYTDLITSIEDMDALVRDSSDQTLPICWKASSSVGSIEDVKHLFKPLTLHFGKSWLLFPLELVIQPEGYLIMSEKGNVCLGILNGAQVHDGSLNILGDISLRGQVFVYDNIGQKIGWVKSDCIEPQKSVDISVFF